VIGIDTDAVRVPPGGVTSGVQFARHTTKGDFMSDVDTTEAEAEAEAQPNAEQRDVGPAEGAVNEVQPQGTVVYPETDAIRAALSGGLPAGNADDVPPGTDTIIAGFQEQLAQQEAEGQEFEYGNARDARWELEGGESARGELSSGEEPARTGDDIA
jgi:hypothetical protein